MAADTEKITKAELLERIRAARRDLEAVLMDIPEEQMLQPGVMGDWSVKDILAHLVSWEKSMVRWITQAVEGETPEIPQTDEEIDQLNARFYLENRDRPLGEVLADFHRSYQAALARVATTSERDLIDPQRFPFRQGRPLWYNAAGNTWWHYEEHAESLRSWLRSQAQANQE